MSKNLSTLKWFKAKRSELKVENQKLQNDLLKQTLERAPKNIVEVEVREERPYTSVKLVNDVLVVVLKDGAVLCKSEATTEDFKAVRDASCEANIFDIISTEEVEEQRAEKAEQAKTANVAKSIEIFNTSEDFEVKGDAIYMKGINRSIPQLLLVAFAKVLVGLHDEDDVFPVEWWTVQYEALKKFWLKCCLNPNAQSAEDLYTFLSHHQFKIDKHGNFYAYRRVCSVSGNTTLTNFISNTYNKVRAVWKKSPKDFTVYKDGEDSYTFSKNSAPIMDLEVVGCLETLYLGLPKMEGNRYTDAHTHTFDYRVGQSVSMPRYMGNDDNTVSCSKGSNWGPLVK